MLKMPKKSRLREVIVLAVILKISLFTVIYLAAHLLPFCYECYGNGFATVPMFPWLHFGTWDAGHYVYLVNFGYQGTGLHHAFYPLFPMLVALVQIVLPDTLLAGLFVSNVASFAAIFLFFQFVKKRWGDMVAFNSVVLFLLFPTGFYLSLMYTESLFVALVLAVFYFWDRENIFLASVMAFFLSLTRPLGVLMAIPVVISCLYRCVQQKSVGFRMSRELLIALGSASGFAAYLFIMYSQTGSLWSGFDAQDYFVAKNSLANLLHPVAWFQKNFLDIDLTLHGFTTSLVDRVFFGGYIVMLYFISRLGDRALFWYALVMGLVPALTGMIMAYTRYLLVVFPIFIVLALRFKKQLLFIALPFCMFQIVFLIMHILNYWVA